MQSSHDEMGNFPSIACALGAGMSDIICAICICTHGISKASARDLLVIMQVEEVPTKQLAFRGTGSDSAKGQCCAA